MITENLSTLKIHKLTQAQYDRELEAGNIDENALYLTPDEEIDLTPYATKEELLTKADSEHGHEFKDINGLQSTVDEIENNINTLSSTVGKKLDTSTASSTYETKTDAVSKLDTAKSYTDTKISNLASTSSVNTSISTHNSSTDSHNDIRILITELTTRLNALADSDDTTLDQLSEIVAYIKNNKELIDEITTSKINVSDIIDNLTTNVSNKPLSAAQGVVIKSLIDALQMNLDGKADTGHNHDDMYYTEDEIDTKIADIPTEVLTVNITSTTADDGTTTYSADKTFDEIKEIYDAGTKEIICIGDKMNNTLRVASPPNNSYLTATYYDVSNSQLYTLLIQSNNTVRFKLVDMVDSSLSTSSTKAVMNKVVTAAINEATSAISANTSSITSHTSAITDLQMNLDELQAVVDDKPTTEYVDSAVQTKLSLPKDSEGNTLNGISGQVATSDGNGGVTWQDGVAKPDWNQNDENAADFIKNKPFGEESAKESTIPSTDVKVTQAVQNVSGVETFDIINGDTYEVYINDEVYTCVAANGYIGDSQPFMLDQIPDGYDGLPFYINGGNSQYVYVYGLDIGSTYTLSVNHIYTKIDQLDEKYVPYVPEYDNVFTINAVQVSSSYDSSTNSYTVTPDKTYAEMMKAVKAGKNVKVIVIPDNDSNDVWYFTLARMYGASSAYFISICNRTYRTLWWNQYNATPTYTMTLNLGGYIASKEYVDEQAELTVPLFVNITSFTTDESITYSANKTFTEIKEAYNAGRDIIAVDATTSALRYYIPLTSLHDIGGATFDSVTPNFDGTQLTLIHIVINSSGVSIFNRAYISVGLITDLSTESKQLVGAINEVSTKVNALSTLPIVTTSDNGKILQVVNGQWALVDPSTLITDDGNGNVNIGGNTALNGNEVEY